MQTRKLTFSAILIAIGVILGNLIYIPVGMSKCFPVQHTINFIAAISLGTGQGVAIAFLISLIRNILATGSLLAFPGSMIGALVAGFLYSRTRKKSMAALGEVIGTGLIGGLLAFPIAKYIMGKEVLALFFVYPFLLSTIGGTLIGIALDRIIDFRSLIGDGDNGSAK